NITAILVPQSLRAPVADLPILTQVGQRDSVTVVIPTRDRPEMLTRCVAAVFDAVGPDDEVIVVDSGSRNAAAVAAAAQPATAIRCDLPGVCRARNAGWKAARSDIVLFADDDVRVDADWVDAFVTCFDAHPETAFVTGRI